MAIFQLARARLRPMGLAKLESSLFAGARLASSSSATTPDYYDILGISKTANQPEIKEAFIKLADEYDHFLDDKSERFMLIMEAYETLREKESRKEYDLTGKANRSLVGDSANATFLIRQGDEEKDKRIEELEEMGDDQTAKEKRDREIREQNQGLLRAACALFVLISVPKMILWVIGNPGFSLTDWAVRDR